MAALAWLCRNTTGTPTNPSRTNLQGPTRSNQRRTPPRPGRSHRPGFLLFILATLLLLTPPTTATPISSLPASEPRTASLQPAAQPTHPHRIAGPRFEHLTPDEIGRVLTFRAGYNAAVVVLGTTLLGIAAGCVGTFALLRGRALMGDALAHAALPGIALAFLAATWLGVAGKSLPLLLTGAAATGVLSVLAIQLMTNHTRLTQDAAIGAALAVFFGLGVVLLSHIQTLRTGAEAGLSGFIYGQAAAMRAADARLMAVLAGGAVVASILLLKEFRLVCFDERFAGSLGWRVGLLDLLMMSLVVVTTVIGLQAVGVLLVVAMLIIPPAAARFWTDRLGVMLLVAALIGGLSGYVGSSISALLPGMPAGGVIVATAGVFFALSMFLAPARGLLAAGVRQANLRLRIASEHLLRWMYEAMESAGRVEPGRPIQADRLTRAASWSPATLRLLSLWMAARGLIRRTDGALALTAPGLDLARRITRRHRLWEEFLVRHADQATTHVDRSADAVEHALSDSMILELEQTLRQRGRLPEEDIAPSVHPIRDRGHEADRGPGGRPGDSPEGGP
jgi:manganese/zinc/iron transport system permease protein